MDLKMSTMDGSTASPSAQDQALLQAEVKAGTSSTTPGYLYLRYDVLGAVPQKLWAHRGKADHLHWKSRQITVQQDCAEGSGKADERGARAGLSIEAGLFSRLAAHVELEWTEASADVEAHELGDGGPVLGHPVLLGDRQPVRAAQQVDRFLFSLGQESIEGGRQPIAGEIGQL